MTTALNCLITSTSDSPTYLPPLNLSNSKYPTTLIIQPIQTKQSTLLTKRYKPSELGDLLMKKIKTQPATSEAGSQDQSPSLKRFEDTLYESSSSKGLEGIESTSMIDEIESPSIKSTGDDIEKIEGQKSFNHLLMAQRSVSTPLIGGSFSLKPFKLTLDNGHKQIQHALEVLQKKLMINQQANILKEILLKVHRAQEPLNIPPLMAPSDSTVSTVKKGRITLRTGDEEQEVIYGDVEYPFLSQSVPFDEANTRKGVSSSSLALKNAMASSKSQDSISSGSSSPVYESVKQNERCLMDLEDSLTATRAETQKSESELEAEKTEGKRRRNNVNKKASPVKASVAAERGKKVQKKEKNQEKEKTRVKREKSPLLSPVRSKRVAERKKNKWQMENQGESNLKVGRQAVEKKVPKVKWNTASQDEEKQIFFEGLRNLLNNNVNEEKTIQENVDDMHKVLEVTESQ